MGGLTLGARYAVRNDLELTIRGEWLKPATFVHDDTIVTTLDGVFVGQAQGQVGRQGASLGVGWMRGLVWRLHAGVEAGWKRLTYNSLDLVDVSAPGTPRTFGLALGAPAEAGFVLSPAIGLEWAFSDHLTASIALRVDVAPGRPSLSSVAVPLTFGWSFYGIRG